MAACSEALTVTTLKEQCALYLLALVSTNATQVTWCKWRQLSKTNIFSRGNSLMVRNLHLLKGNSLIISTKKRNLRNPSLELRTPETPRAGPACGHITLPELLQAQPEVAAINPSPEALDWVWEDRHPYKGPHFRCCQVRIKQYQALTPLDMEKLDALKAPSPISERLARSGQLYGFALRKKC